MNVRSQVWAGAPRAERRRTRSWRGRCRDCTVALASGSVVAFLVAYAFTSPSFALDTTVADVTQHPGAQAILEGRVRDAGGDAVADAVIRADRPGRENRARSGKRGYFRLALHGPCAVSRINLVVHAEGGPVRSTLRRRLCPGEAVEIDARLVGGGQPIWFPTR